VRVVTAIASRILAVGLCSGSYHVWRHLLLLPEGKLSAPVVAVVCRLRLDGAVTFRTCSWCLRM
jgi:hypothetical protein